MKKVITAYLPVKSLQMDGKGIRRFADEHNVRSF